jgi:hypothetical protein
LPKENIGHKQKNYELTILFWCVIIVSVESGFHIFSKKGESGMSKSLKLFIFVLIVAFALTACGGKPDTDGVVGTYTLKGTNPDKSTYEGTLDVTAAGEAFNWSWNGGEYKGIGLQQGDTVSVAWGSDACYVVSYVIGNDGVLTGRWTDMAASGIGSDIATPTDMMGEGLEGLYNAAGKNPDGSDYGCSLQVTKKAENVYEWYWFNCGEYTGVGIQNGEVVSVAYGASECSAMSYKVNANGSMDAVWTYVGQTALGTENAKPK